MAALAVALLAAVPASAQKGAPGRGDQSDRHVRIYNDTSVVLREFYASNVGRSTWEEDILGTNVLRPGQSVNVNVDDGTGACVFDFKAVFSDGTSRVHNRIDVCRVHEHRYGAAGDASVRSTDGQNRRVRIINETSRTIREFYASNVDRTTWEQNILRDTIIRPGQSVTVNIDDGSGACLFDFKAVFTDSSSRVKNRINVCRIDSYRYTD